jgi:hypothetical protein
MHPAPHRPGRVAPARKQRILVVDDSAAHPLWLERMLAERVRHARWWVQVSDQNPEVGLSLSRREERGEGATPWQCGD